MTRSRRHRLCDLLGCVPVKELLNPAATSITSISDDSRQVSKGALFVAVPGSRTDGHLYIADALERGAAAAVCERTPEPLPSCPVALVADSRRARSALADAFYGSPARELRITGVTGTDGKTSTTEILRAILNEAGCVAHSVGTLGYRTAARWHETGLTTPCPIKLHGLFRRMADAGVEDCCMEVSSESLVQDRVRDVDFDAAVLTNITQDHLNTHGTRENYARAKRILFEQLEPRTIAALPAGSEFLDPFRGATRAEVLTYGMGQVADVRARILDLRMTGMELLVQTPLDGYTVRTGLIGSFNCLNILAAATVAFGFGIRAAAVKEALRTFAGVPGRLEQVSLAARDDLPAVVVDYAHTPAALEKVLGVLRPLVPGKLICVVGCGGDRDTTKRPLMGRIASEGADAVVFTADNSRNEQTEDIIAQMLEGVGRARGACHVEPDRRQAIERAVRLAAGPDSMVAICGKGCEQYLDLGDRRIPFDDRVVARQVLEQAPRTRRKSA